MPTLLGYLCKGLIFTGFDKTFIIMANTELRFLCDTQNGDYIKVFETRKERIVISITEEETREQLEIVLDKSTAIKFAKTLRTEINNIKEPF